MRLLQQHAQLAGGGRIHPDGPGTSSPLQQQTSSSTGSISAGGADCSKRGAIGSDNTHWRTGTWEMRLRRLRSTGWRKALLTAGGFHAWTKLQRTC